MVSMAPAATKGPRARILRIGESRLISDTLTSFYILWEMLGNNRLPLGSICLLCCHGDLPILVYD